MRSPRVRDWLLPLLVLAFTGTAVRFLSDIFNPTTRWGVLVVVASYLLLKGQVAAPFRTTVGWLAFASAFWALTTSTWSEVPELSFLKSLAFAAIALCACAIGQYWTRTRPVHNCLDYLYPLAVVVTIAAAAGGVTDTAIIETGDKVLYQGAVAGPNMFGTLVAMAAPIVLWHLYRHWGNPRQRAVTLGVAGVLLYFLLASGSRAAMLVVLCIALGFLLTVGTRRRMMLAVLVVAGAGAAYLVAPRELENAVKTIAYKQANLEEDTVIYHSRKDAWEESYDAAQLGGWTGVGYGVSVGDASFAGGFTATGYGREKGNSQLAIVEETGLVGLIIYLALQVALFARLLSRVRLLPQGPDKVLFGIILGTLVGLTAHSFFEAWWSAPASPESVYFWSLTGVALALGVARRPAESPAFRAAEVGARARPWLR